MHKVNPTTLTTEELMRYAQLFLDRKENMPMSWQEELLKRLAKEIDKQLLC